MRTRKNVALAILLLLAAALAGCKLTPKTGTLERRTGDEMVVAGQFVHTGTPVVLWMDPGGYDAYRVERRFSPIESAGWEKSKEEVKDLDSPNRYNLRSSGLTEQEIERVRGGGWDLATLQKVVDQFVLHYDVCGTSRQCFKVLHDMRDLSVHFLLDLDGTIYQTLDLKERAWHATTSNSRSVGIEIANMGAYPPAAKNPFADWYEKTPDGGTRIVIPERLGGGGVRTPDFTGHPARPEPVTGVIHGGELVQYDFTPQQYAALIKLTAALSKVLPRIACDYPRDASGTLLQSRLTDEQLRDYHGVLGHFHIQTNKVDPGPAFQWDYVIDSARRLLHGGFSNSADGTSKGHLRE
ncbi:MAG TPA: N-acetylmuramoyl-L-alanine amidase [Verrucomicrobiae bacterium]